MQLSIDPSLRIKRYPKSENRSLRAWSAADEHIVHYLSALKLSGSSLAIYHDRFGYLSCHLHAFRPVSILNYKSQEKSICENLLKNELDISTHQFAYSLQNLSHVIDIAIVRIPKALGLFRLYLYQLSQSLSEDGIVVCGFMTRHFSKQMLSISAEFFEEMEQTRAWKKSRLLLLKKKKPFQERSLLQTIHLNETESLQQYLGVFSARNIDYASQFLMEHMSPKDSDKKIMDLASGNGVLAYYIRKRLATSELHLVDDDILAVESSKLNLTHSNTFFHYQDTLEFFEDNTFDLVVSNPPFHFEYETNIEIAISLFKEVQRCLTPHGRFLMVASKHLNFKTHLNRIFNETVILADNAKFVIYRCLK